MKYYPSERYRTEKSLQRQFPLMRIHAYSNCYNLLRIPCVKLFFQSKHLKLILSYKYERMMHFMICIDNVNDDETDVSMISIKYWNCVRRIKIDF